MGKRESAILHGRLDTLATLFHHVVGQTYHVEVGHLCRTYINLDFDAISVDSVNGGTVGFEQHSVASSRS